MLRSRVSVLNQFGRVERRLSELAQRSCVEAARAGAQAAAEIAAKRRLPISEQPLAPTEDGWLAGFECVHPAAWYQDLGTLGNRERPLKRPPSGKRTHAPGTGITPLYFLEAGKKAGRRVQREVIRQGLRQL